MYDAISARYRFSCPARGEEQVQLSSFRLLDRLPGARHPAVFQVLFACPCGGSHQGLVSADDLDWAPLGAGFGSFVNLMTGRSDNAGEDMLVRAAQMIKSGCWPWSFFCYAEGEMRPAVPSSFVALSPSGSDVGLLVRCASCQTLSINVVSRHHLDVPFYNDREVAVVGHVFAADFELIAQSFAAELWSERFDVQRRLL